VQQWSVAWLVVVPFSFSSMRTRRVGSLQIWLVGVCGNNQKSTFQREMLMVKVNNCSEL
jgi:hypothetical protein